MGVTALQQLWGCRITPPWVLPLQRRVTAFRWAPLLPLPACGERVGVRGPFPRLRLAERPPHPPPPFPPPLAGEGRVGATSPRKRGEGKAEAKCAAAAKRPPGRQLGGRQPRIDHT